MLLYSEHMKQIALSDSECSVRWDAEYFSESLTNII